MRWKITDRRKQAAGPSGRLGAGPTGRKRGTPCVVTAEQSDKVILVRCEVRGGPLDGRCFKVWFEPSLSWEDLRRWKQSLRARCFAQETDLPLELGWQEITQLRLRRKAGSNYVLKPHEAEALLDVFARAANHAVQF